MIITNPTSIPPSPYPITLKNTKSFRTTLAKKQDFTKNTQNKSPNILSFKNPKVLLAQSAIVVLGLGFIDAGYSGDWSRIGVISKETEEFLKIAAFLVVPLCIFLVYSLFKEQEDS
ncbi:hypothetical protein ACHQM5_030037 [Ranunculus cassubicifolius]